MLFLGPSETKDCLIGTNHFLTALVSSQPGLSGEIKNKYVLQLYGVNLFNGLVQPFCREDNVYRSSNSKIKM